MPRRLSRRERQVMRGIAGGRTSKQIATLLDIAPSTVDWHVANALAKLRAANRAEGVAIALQRGELRRGPWAIGRAVGWVGGPWRALAAAIVLALVVPTVVASDAGPASPAVGSTAPAPVRVSAPARPTTTLLIVPFVERTAPSATATAPTPAPTMPASPSATTAAPAVSSVPAVSSHPAAATLAPPTSPPILPPLSTAAPVPTLPTVSPELSAAPLPTITPLPTVTAPTIPLATLQPPSLPTIQPAPSLLPSLSPMPSLP